MAIAKQKIGAIAIAALISANMGVTAFASEESITPPDSTEQQESSSTLIQQEGDGYSSITIYDGVSEITGPQYTGEMENGFSSVGETNPTRYYPFEITNVDEHGTWLVVKSYEVSSDVDPERDLVETNIVRDGKHYAARDILQKKTPGSTDSREAKKQVTITSDSDKKSDILKLLDDTTFYSEGGYEGYLTLDQSSIESEVSGTSSYSYPITEKKEYTGLTRNDPSLIEKSISKNGITLTLSDVSWVSMGSTISGDSIVSTYKAVATYSGTGYGSKADGYIVTAEYSGTVTKEVSGDYIYSIIYAPVEEKSGGLFGFGSGNDTQTNGGNETTVGNNSITLGEGTNSFLSNFKSLAGFMGIAILIALFLSGVYFLVVKIKSQNGNSREEREPLDLQEKPKRKGFNAFWKKKKNRTKGKDDLSDDLDDVNEYDEIEENFIEPEEPADEYEESEEVEINSMDFYEDPSDDVLQVTVDDDPELSAMFEEENSYYEPEEEPLENKK